MRTVVFVQRQELELKGNLSPNALVLGDVDNDSVNTIQPLVDNVFISMFVTRNWYY